MVKMEKRVEFGPHPFGRSPAKVLLLLATPQRI